MNRASAFAVAGFLTVGVAAPGSVAHPAERNASSNGETLHLTRASLSELAAALRSGTTSSVELTVLHLNRIMAYDRRGPRLNAVPVLNPRALDEAARADALRRLGVELSPLHGIPFVVKDSYNVAGLPTSAGIAAWKTLRPTKDAFVVARLRQAGAVLLGKTNLDTFAAGSDGFSQAFGQVRNPYGAKAVGGSSAGSAVAVAAHLAAFSLGGDTAGSLRMPASRNDVVSMRPTLGLISTAGTTPGDPLFDVLGPMARTVEDLARVLDVVVARDPENPLESYLPEPDLRRPSSYVPARPAPSLKGMTFAVPRRLVGRETEGARVLTPGAAVLEVFSRIRRQLERAGATVRDVDVPVDEALDDTWYYDRDVSQAGAVAKPIYDARVALVNVRAFAGEFRKFCEGWCGDPADRLLDVAAVYDYPEFMEAFRALREGTALDPRSRPVAAALEAAASLEKGPLFAQWMARQKIDALLFPASSDGDSDTRFGLNYLSELGAPGLFVPGGFIEVASKDAVQPLGVALVTPRFEERRLLSLGLALEQALQARRNPATTPALADEALKPRTRASRREGMPADVEPPHLAIQHVDLSSDAIVSGTASDASGIADLRVYVNGEKAVLTVEGASWKARLAAAASRDAQCIEDGLVIVFARDGAGNTAAASRPLAPAERCAPP